ncbi:hypothetical protein AB7315_21550 [Providencia manganoxydans]|uniref:hypothetical protein n=1 Tax=Providencia manganoxydans TaxID=2923283 RepID=UPI0034E612E5
MMRSESKEIYGANVFGLVAMLHQLRRWWILRELRLNWAENYKYLVMCRKHSHLNKHIEYFSIQQRYERIRLFAMPHQQRGAI